MNKTVRNAIRFTLMTCAASALSSPAVFAQNAPASSAQNQNITTQLGKVEVTGTRIKRTNVETAQPITIISSAQIRQSGLATVAAVLQNITQSGQPTTPETQVNNGTDTVSADLRYFGSSRVLVLVNGHRWPTGNLSSIPTSMIDHVEVLQDGASAIYGSDAITGVINFITVKNFNGAEAHAFMGMYDNDYGGLSGWDGKTQQYNFTVGSSGTRGGAVVNAEYQENDEIFARDRAQSKEPHWTQSAGRFTPNEPGFYEIQSPQLANTTLGQATCSASGVCNLGTLDIPTNNPTLDNFTDRATDNYYEQYWLPFLEPQQTSSIYFHAHYNLADNLTFTSMAAYNLQDSQDIIAPGRWFFGEHGTYTANGKGIGIGANNPYNPFGVDLVGNASQYCPDGKTLGGAPVASCTPNYLLKLYHRYSVELGPRPFDNRNSNLVFRMGLNGFFDALGSEWDWELDSNYGNNYNVGTNGGFVNTSRLASQFDSPGVQSCNGPAQSVPGSTGTWDKINGQYYQILLPGCVPMNPFGGYNAATGQGSITPEMMAYSQAAEHVVGASAIHDYTADITGNLAQLPAGPLAVDVGGEYLEQNGFTSPDNLTVEGNLNENASQPTGGREWTHAEYIEFNIPLLANVPLAKSLSLDVANRWSQFSWHDAEPPTSPGWGPDGGTHASTGRAQMRWQLTDSLLLRGSWSQGFRTPSIGNLYAAEGQALPMTTDPCAPDTLNGGWNPATPLPPGCHGMVHVQPSPELLQISSGNAKLTPETAISRSFGFEYSPDWLPGLNAGADFYKIDLGNTIGSVGINYILDQCYLNNDPSFCKFITMNGNSISSVNVSPKNIGEEYSNGIDVNADYTMPTTSIGNFRFSTNWTFVRSFVAVVPSGVSPTGFASLEKAGYANPGYSSQIVKAKGNVGINWNMENWSAVWNILYIGKVFEPCSATTISLNECSQPNTYDPDTDTMGENELGTTIYHDVAVTYHADPINTSFTFGIRNLFNKQYPIALRAIHNGFLHGVPYRIPGRFFYARIGVKF